MLNIKHKRGTKKLQTKDDSLKSKTDNGTNKGKQKKKTITHTKTKRSTKIEQHTKTHDKRYEIQRKKGTQCHANRYTESKRQTCTL